MNAVGVSCAQRMLLHKIATQWCTLWHSVLSCKMNTNFQLTNSSLLNWVYQYWHQSPILTNYLHQFQLIKLSLISWMLYFKAICDTSFWNAPDTICCHHRCCFSFFILHWILTTLSFIIFGRHFYNFKHQKSIEYFTKDS